MEAIPVSSGVYPIADGKSLCHHSSDRTVLILLIGILKVRLAVLALGMVKKEVH